MKFDHVIFGCTDLDVGIAALGTEFGAPPSGRGVHRMMGTHNALWNMGDAYIELVAIDLAAAHPGRPRWFGLDDPDVQARFGAGPRLLTWALAGAEVERVAGGAPMPMGSMEVFSRDDLKWRVAVPQAGTPGMDGIFPLTLDWLEGQHPAARLGDQGLRCRSLALSHPEIEHLKNVLGDPPDRVSLHHGPAQIAFTIDTAKGALRYTAF